MKWRRGLTPDYSKRCTSTSCWTLRWRTPTPTASALGCWRTFGLKLQPSPCLVSNLPATTCRGVVPKTPDPCNPPADRHLCHSSGDSFGVRSAMYTQTCRLPLTGQYNNKQRIHNHRQVGTQSHSDTSKHTGAQRCSAAESQNGECSLQ